MDVDNILETSKLRWTINNGFNEKPLTGEQLIESDLK